MGIINKTKDFIKKIGIKKFTVIIVLLIVVIFSFIKLVSYLTSDRMNNAGIAKVKYRVYTKEHGWSKWCKNGTTCGNGKDDILDIEIKMKDDAPIINKYVNKKWIKDNKKKKIINQISIVNNGFYLRNYDMCYRTYNSTDKWLGWAFNTETSGNSSESIKKVEIKVIPKHVIYSEYLRDYLTNYNFSFKGNE